MIESRAPASVRPLVPTADGVGAPSSPTPSTENTERGRAQHPPKTKLVLRVGVTGHRPDPSKRPSPDVAEIRNTAREILRHIADGVDGVANFNRDDFSSKPNVIRLISALAEGPDQWIADEALRLGYVLHTALPFRREEYARGFGSPQTREGFARLVREAESVLELDGSVSVASDGTRSSEGPAYEAVNRAVLNQSDLLIAVWDGELARGIGGTGSVVAEALRRGIPIVWLKWSAPTEWVLKMPEWRLMMKPAEIHASAKVLKDVVRELLAPPEHRGGDIHRGSATSRQQYFDETNKTDNPLHGWWRGLLSTGTGPINRVAEFGTQMSRRFFHIPDLEGAIGEEWRARQTLGRDESADFTTHAFARSVDEQYAPHYAWANQLSVYYGNQYRSAFVLSYVLGALAVLLALIGSTAKLGNVANGVFVAMELASICAILFLTSYGRQRKWHERWIDYRTLAERLRLSKYLALWWGGGQEIPGPAHLATYGKPSATWMHWHYRMVERAVVLPSVCFTPEYLEWARRAWADGLVEDQIRYHAETQRRYHALDRALHMSGGALFFLTLCACVVHLVLLGRQPFDWWATVLSAVLPAFAAAFAAIRTQAELQRLARRSLAMEESLKQMKEDLLFVSVRGGEGNSTKLHRGADRVAELMIREMLDWRVILVDRPLESHR